MDRITNDRAQASGRARGRQARDEAPDALAQPRPAPLEIAAFGEWDTANLGDRGIHDGVQRFFAGGGWGVRSFGISSLAPVAPDGPHGEAAPAGAGGPVRAMLRAAPRLKRTLRGARQRVRMAGLLAELAQVQAIAVGGGALLSDTNLHFPQSLAQLARAARRLDQPLLCLGCSAEGDWSGPGAAMIRDFLAACHVIAARDEATAARLAELLGEPPPVFGDFCLSEEHVLDEAARGEERLAMAVNVCQLEGPWAPEQARYEEAMVSLVNALARGAQARRAAIRIFTTGTVEDARAAERVFARLAARGAELHVPRNLAQLTAVLRTSSVAVATRLHAAVLALAARTPAVGFSPAPKLHYFFSTVGIRRHVHGLGEGQRLAEWLAAADHDALYAEQRRALVRAPVWAGRARVRSQLEALAATGVECR